MNTVLSPRSGRTRLIILVSVLVAASLPAMWLFGRSPALPDVDAGKTVAEEFLGSIRMGKPDVAWESTTAEFKSAQGKESFAREVKGLAWLKESIDFVSTQTVNMNEQPRSEYVYRSPKGPKARLILGRENGVWKVDRLILEK